MKSRGLLTAALLTAAFAAPAFGQGKAVEFRTGDAFSGPVKSARIERATYRRVGGELVEGPRHLVSVSSYTPDGKRREQESYAPGGSLRARYVHVYDDAGSEVEMSWFDGDGSLLMRVVSRPAAGERLTYNGDGTLRERSVVVKGPDGGLAETRLYDGVGALKERSVNTREGELSVWSTYRADGSLKTRVTHTLNYGGPHRTEETHYGPDGALVGRRVAGSDAAASDLRADKEGGGPGAPGKTRQTREYDSRRNLSKITDYAWNEGLGVYEPRAVSYYTITYYR